MCSVIDLGSVCSVGTTAQSEYRCAFQGSVGVSKEETWECNLEEKRCRGCCARVCCQDPRKLDCARTEFHLGGSHKDAAGFSTADLSCEVDSCEDGIN